MILTAVSGAGWLLSLHVLAAFAVGAPVTALVIAAAITSGDSATMPALAGLVRVSAAVLRLGVAATLVLGLWLVLTRDAYSLLDTWVIAAILLWLVIGGLSDMGISRLRRMTGKAVGSGLPVPHVRGLLWLELGAAAATVAEFALMIWRPGA